MAITQTRNPFVLSLSSSSLPPPPNSIKLSKNKLNKCITSSEFSVLLQSCIDIRSLKQGVKLHSQIKQAGFEKNQDLLPKLIKLYSVCGQVDDARELFDGIPKRNLDTFIWTAMISGYVRNGLPSESFRLFCEMLELGFKPDDYTFSALLKASAELGIIRLTDQLHSLLAKRGLTNGLSVENSLMHAYGSAGDIGGARKVFDRMHLRDIVSWSSIIRAYSSFEKFSESVGLFSRMQFEDGLKPNEITIVSLLPACGFFSSLRKGQSIHGYIIRNGLELNLIVGSALVTMYCSCGDPDSAFKVFSGLGKGNVILWTSMMKDSL